jgi:hypothetical protein
LRWRFSSTGSIPSSSLLRASSRALRASCNEDVRERAEGKLLLDPELPEAETPEEGACRLHQKEEAFGVRDLVRSSCRLERANLGRCKHSGPRLL